MSDLLTEAKGLREERGRVANDMVQLANLARTEERSLSGEEQSKFDKLNNACTDLEKRFSTLEAAAKQSIETEEIAEIEAHRSKSNAEVNQMQEMAFRGWAKGPSGATPEEREAANAAGVDINQRKWTVWLPQFRDGIRPRTVQEFRQMRRDCPENISTRYSHDVITRATTAQSITTAAGGDVIQDQAMSALQEALLQGGNLRSVATVITTPTGASWPVPSVNSTDKGALLAINTAAITQDVVFGQQVLDAKKYTSNMVKVPMELGQDSTVNLAAFLGGALGSRIRRISEEHFATGAASLGEPEGLVTTGTTGGSGAGNTQSSIGNITYTDILGLVHSVDPSYRNGADSQFMMHDSVFENIRGQVDGDGRPLWRPSLEASAPDSLLGYPVVINQEYGAFTGTSDNAIKLATFGPHSHYWIRDVAAVTILRLDERFAELAQTAFLAFSRHDGEYINTNSSNASIRHLVSTST